MKTSALNFGPFAVTSQVFHLSPTQLTFGLVNLKPLLPGHVLVCPVRVTPRLSQLTPHETADLFNTVQRVSRTLQRLFKADAFNVAVQDGVEAGQSVPHVHVHVIPRRRKDMDERGGGDAIYGLMDGEEGDLGTRFVEMWRRKRQMEADKSPPFVAGPDSDRKPRNDEEMGREADWLRREMEKDEDEAK